jgi:GNAT superfamily N-acetyltransferase
MAAVEGAVATVTQANEPGFVHVETTWRKGQEEVAICKIDCFANYVIYTCLFVAEPYRGKGIYQRFILNYFRWYQSIGVKTLFATPQNERSEYLLALGGFRWIEIEGREHFAVRDSEESRMEMYLIWLEEGHPEATEPQWHKELRERPIQDEEGSTRSSSYLREGNK